MKGSYSILRDVCKGNYGYTLDKLMHRLSEGSFPNASTIKQADWFLQFMLIRGRDKS